MPCSATREPLWRAWLEDAQRRYRVELDDGVDEASLDAAVGNWRVLLKRFAEACASTCGPTRRPTRSSAASPQPASASALLHPSRSRSRAVAAAHLGVARRLERLEAGPGALERLLDAVGRDAVVVGSLAELQSV